MKVLLAALNAKYIHSNLAVYSLRAYARQRGYETGIAEYTINQPVDEILMDIYKRNPGLLCFSCYLWNIALVEQLITEVPKNLPDTEIWLGGPEVSYNATEMLRHFPAVKGIMCGEGEETFAEVLEYYEHLQNAESPLINGLESIRGIVYRERNGATKENQPRPVIDLSTVPFVYENIGDFRNRIIYYESSRGCLFSCSYCLSSIDKCLRFRDLSLVKQELKFFIDNEVPQVKFVDRTFNCRHGHAMEIWRFIREHDRGITNFHFEIAADLLNEEELGLICSMRPGLVQLEIGVQSTNEQTISEIHRKMDLEKVRENVARIKEAGNAHQHLDLIAGLPCEDYESFGHSFNEVYAMRPEQLQLGFLKVLKGSLMYERAGEYSLVCQERPPYEVLSTKWLTYADIIRLKRVEEMVEVYYNSGQFAGTMERLEKEFDSAFRMYEEMGEYYEENGLFGMNHSRLARYEILWHFIMDRGSRKTESGIRRPLEEYRESLAVDLYLRENVKNRPVFLGKDSVTKEEAAAFYREEVVQRRYLKSYDEYDGRQMRKMTHLERADGRLLLFDYRNRNALTQNAAVYIVEER